MTIQDYLRGLREQWIIVVIAIAVGLLCAGVAWFIRPPEYTANLTMYVSAQGGDTASSAYQGALLSQQRVTSYVKLVSSTRVSGEVIRQLGLVDTPEEVAKQITASSTPDSVLVDVAVTGRSPQQVAKMANAVGKALTTLVDELERPSSPNGVPPVAVRVVQPAVAPAVPSSTGLPVMLAVGLVTGLPIGVAAALARNALDT